MSDPVSDLKHELLVAAERQYGLAAARARHRRRIRLLLASAAVSIAAAAALFITAPWSSSPGFLARAEAALTPPAGTVLHMKWEVTSTSTDPVCTVARGPSEIWIDQTTPHSYRAVINDFPSGSGKCRSAQARLLERSSVGARRCVRYWADAPICAAEHAERQPAAVHLFT